jgi:pimeloyl-ACP methyl ester carboxylesterase
VVSSDAIHDDKHVLLFDPLAVPSEIEELATSRETAIVLTCPWHRRDALSVAETIGASIYVPPPDEGDPEPVGGQVFRAGDRLPVGVEALKAWSRTTSRSPDTWPTRARVECDQANLPRIRFLGEARARIRARLGRRRRRGGRWARRVRRARLRASRRRVRLRSGMQVEVNGTRLWFDVEGTAVAPDGAEMRERPTVILVHGGPGSYDHSYFKPEFSRLTEVAQIVYLDLRGHGRSDWGDAEAWSFEACADDVRAFCDALDIARPVVYGHSMGGFVVMLYAARHPGHAEAIVLQSTNARFDLDRLVEGVRRLGGDEVAAIAERSYGGGEAPSPDEWSRVFALFGPQIPDEDELARRIRNTDVGTHGMELLRAFDVVDELSNVECPTLVCVGELDPITPVAASREIVDALPDGIARLEVIEGAGHFTWKDAPERYWPLVSEFATAPNIMR